MRMRRLCRPDHKEGHVQRDTQAVLAKRRASVNHPHSTTPEHQCTTFCKCRYCLIAAHPCVTWPSYIMLVGWVLHLCAYRWGKLGERPLRDTAAAPRGFTSRARLMAKILAKGLSLIRPLPVCSLRAAVWGPPSRESKEMVWRQAWAGVEGHPSVHPSRKQPQGPHVCSVFQLSLL